ncbi:RimJ/RimL family protein N-acetyltransferase [Conyzicola lurida]|uniref:RimJ/RimL family protein N-acetyltransferase n=1 Tax=Conyzicola lurida TaxID=1172621 RepID=A0A841AKT9_9MICO|nr:hypothetical protein [Conyzicola lurida]MBB5844560.1 RimJ/RimL family protein N-acetyltransferase [Conyzicola lurida]
MPVTHRTPVNAGPPTIILLPFTEEGATRVLAGLKRPGEEWARDYPLFHELDFLRALLLDRAAGTDPGVFGMYQVRLSDSTLVIGGASFFGPPDEFGAVEILVGIVPDYADGSYAAHAVAQLVRIAADNGARYVIGSADVVDTAAIDGLLQGGLDEVVRDDTIAHFARELTA